MSGPRDTTPAPPPPPGVDPEVVEIACTDLDDAVAVLDGLRLTLDGLATLLRRQVAAARAGE